MSDMAARPETGEELPEELYGVSDEQVAAVREALHGDDIARVRELCEGLHAADLADLIHTLPPAERRKLIDVLGAGIDPELLTFLEDHALDEVVQHLGAADIAAAVTELDTDDALDVVELLDEPVKEQILDHLEDADRAAIEEALAYPEDSAGRLMQRSFVAFPSHWTVGDAIDYFREEADKGGETLPDEFFDIFVVDEDNHPLGVVPLSEVIRTRRLVTLGELMDADLDRVPVDTDQEEVGNLFRQYDLTSAAVVDADGRMVGVITYDDVMDVVHEEAEEDIMRLAGVPEEGVDDTVLRTSRSRVSWLVVSLLGLLFASLVIWLFEDAIQEIVALAVLMPIVAALGGNAGIQAMTVTVRSLAMRDFNRAAMFRVLGREVMVAALNGLVLAVIVGTLTGLWFATPELGFIIGGAVIVNLTVAGTMGVLIPLTLDRLKIDPAIASSVFLITITDTVGFAAFLGSAAAFLL
ncbi:MAG: magnesium transporter [Acetobacterales bacterium]